MAMLRLPCDIQSLFCASTQICSYKRAVEELIYNSLDAESTSIAIRINIERGTIQVIDNGCGVSKYNFSLIGQRHATSKCVDLSTLKSIPNKYGYRGQSLASIIEVSQSVKITSRCEDSEETWIKSFYKGKEQNLCVGVQRPSKGITIDIKGFLYNLKIQKKTINSMNELYDIEVFLEQLSLVHNNISLSLRDDAKNEIIFQLHKNRDIYQTLRSMFGIKKTDLQELKVEKNNYKVSAFIGKEDNELCNKHWIYLNGKHLQSNKLQTIVNDSFIKSLKLNHQNRRKVKSKNPYNQEDDLDQKRIPVYFIFITCPYYDYDINQISKQTVVEFKDWTPINKLIEKMAKFYAGDVNMKELKPVINQIVNQQKNDDTRDQVKKIMNKILGSNPRRIGVSQMQNGIKGKITKRNIKKNRTKILHSKNQQVTSKNDNKCKKITNLKEQTPLCDVLQVETVEKTPIENKMAKEASNKLNKKVKPLKVSVNNAKGKKNYVLKKKNKDEKSLNGKNKIHTIRKMHAKIGKKHKSTTNHKEKYINNKLNKNNNLKTHKDNINNLQKSKKVVNTIRLKNNKPKVKTSNFIKFFVDDPTGSVKKRCNILANKVDELISYNKKRKCKIFINETVQYSNITKNNKNYSIRKKIGEIVIHDYIPKPPSYISCTYDDRDWDKTNKKPYLSSYDRMQNILKTQETKNSCREVVDVAGNSNFKSPKITNDDIILSTHHDKIFKPDYIDLTNDSPNISHAPRLTFESHNYVENCNQSSHNHYIKNYVYEKPKEKTIQKRFITNKSKQNFVIPLITPKAIKKRPKIKLNHIEIQSNKLHKFTKQFESNQESSYTIDFTKSNEKNVLKEKSTIIQHFDLPSSFNETQNENRTYTIEQNYEINSNINSGIRLTHNIHNSYRENDNLCKDDENILGDINKKNNRDNCKQSEDEENVDYIVDSSENAVQSKLRPNDVFIENENFVINNRQCEQIKMNVVFISKSREKEKSNDIEIQTSLDKQINPLNICETVLSQNEYEEHNANHIEWNDSLFNDEFNIDSFLCDRNAYTLRGFSDTNITKPDVTPNFAWNNDFVSLESKNVGFNTTSAEDHTNLHENTASKYEHCDKNNTLMEDTNHFNFKGRHRFVPKGMSQIFTKCQSRNICDYNLGKDYYKKEIYNDFANNVQLNCEILEPRVQSVNELTTKAIDKVNYKLNKENASLIFNGESLKETKVLKQIDNKFIAAKISGRSHYSQETKEYLVLFDQHAVHERIRLETNLSEYFDGNEWKSMPLDDIKLKVSKDEILYLHNYKNKFNLLGLQWTVLSNNEVAINAIPQAVLGKNPRQVDIVMKAIKNLIVEEISAIKSQSGCIALYPKAIMDLVFSEACRYAIKFGDRLSKNECVDLLYSLSECMTPFQCAHGRPVMAVLMDIKADMKKYTINMDSVQKWRRFNKKYKN